MWRARNDKLEILEMLTSGIGETAIGAARVQNFGPMGSGGKAYFFINQLLPL